MNVASDTDNSVIPPTVARNAARAEAIVAELAAKRLAQVPTPPPIPIVLPAETPPQVNPESTPQSASAQNTPTHPTDAGLQHQYNSMKGRLERAESERKQLLQQQVEYQQLIATMQAAAQPAPNTPPAQQRLITPVEETEYGLEMLDVVGRRAREIVSPEVAVLRAELEAVKRQVGGVTQAVVQDARQKMFADMDAQLPNWRVQNDDPNFISWLALPDPYSGAIRHQLLNQAFAGNQTSRVVKFFQGFLADEAATRPVGASGVRSGTKVPDLSLESLAAPGRARQTGGSSPPVEKPIYTRDQVAKFYSDVRANAFVGRDADKIAIEKAIFEAAKDGRIR